MIIYEGIYRLPGGSRGPAGPFGGLEYAWWVRIIDFSMSRPDIRHLKPFAVYATQAGEGEYKTSCAESAGIRVLHDFHLDADKVLWVEHFRDRPGRLHAAVFTSSTAWRPDGAHRVSWRPIRPNELTAIQPFIPEARFIG
ncbi:MAG: hypothetical protein GY859_37895 [Desulfobacterales bacterium]|nr:hypothetical protein [Desulfobacterales bacterium]